MDTITCKIHVCGLPLMSLDSVSLFVKGREFELSTRQAGYDSVNLSWLSHHNCQHQLSKVAQGGSFLHR